MLGQQPIRFKNKYNDNLKIGAKYNYKMLKTRGRRKQDFFFKATRNEWNEYKIVIDRVDINPI